jgi:uncharacterized protein (TIGR02611 family)
VAFGTPGGRPDVGFFVETAADETMVGDGPGADRPAAVPRWLHPARAWVHARPGGALVWRILIAVLGLVVVAVGLLLVPLPGPGWVIVFAGLAIWATEFGWARRLLLFARALLRRWTDWARGQSRLAQGALGLAGLVLLAGLAWLGWQLVR